MSHIVRVTLLCGRSLLLDLPCRRSSSFILWSLSRLSEDSLGELNMSTLIAPKEDTLYWDQLIVFRKVGRGHKHVFLNSALS